MFFFYGLTGLVVLALWVFCLFDVITTDEADCRNLPKGLWLVVVIFLPTIGSIMWLIAGRPAIPTARPQFHIGGTTYPEYDRPGRFAATNPDDDEEFLRRRERAEEQRRKAREQDTTDE